MGLNEIKVLREQGFLDAINSALTYVSDKKDYAINCHNQEMIDAYSDVLTWLCKKKANIEEEA